MKKIISLLVIALLSITTIVNVNAMGSSATKENLIINGKQIASWEMIMIYWCSNWSSICYEIRNRNGQINPTQKYYKYDTGNISEIKEGDLKIDLSNQENWTISKHYKLEKNDESGMTKVFVDGKLDGSFYTDFDSFYEISNNAFYYNYNLENWEKNYKVFVFWDTKVETTPIQETQKTTQANPQLDKVLNPFFEKTDKKWEEKAQQIYKTIISKLDVLLQKKLSVKNKNILNYLKEKLEEKIK